MGCGQAKESPVDVHVPDPGTSLQEGPGGGLTSPTPSKDTGAMKEVEVAKDDPSASATVNAAKAAAPTEAPPTAADKLLAASFPPGTPVDTQKAILAEVVRMRRLDPDEYARLGSKYVDAGELWAALEALDGTATLLLRASWVKTQRGGRLPKRGTLLPREAFITVQELREIHAKSSAKHALPVIALSQCVPPC